MIFVIYHTVLTVLDLALFSRAHTQGVNPWKMMMRTICIQS